MTKNKLLISLMAINSIFMCFLLLLGSVIHSIGQTKKVHISGAMRNVMMKGELQATIDLDTIRNKEHLYGLGPLEYLRGEILVKDGVAYKGTVDASPMQVEKSFDVKAPFFVYANIDQWKEYGLPDSVHTLSQLDAHLDHISVNRSRPFAFKLVGNVIEADIHLVNLPANTKVNSPADAHLGQRDFKLQQKEVEMIGFFSTQHKAIFTHHDSNIHVHLITADEKTMGHLDAVRFDAKNIKLYLPE